MRGDFSRIRFEPNKHYTSVLEQQGRVALDADYNEQRAIDETLRRTEIIDVIGPFGGPDRERRRVVHEVLVSGEPVLRVGRERPCGLVLRADRSGDRDVALSEWDARGNAEAEDRVEQTQRAAKDEHEQEATAA